MSIDKLLEERKEIERFKDDFNSFRWSGEKLKKIYRGSVPVKLMNVKTLYYGHDSLGSFVGTK